MSLRASDPEAVRRALAELHPPLQRRLAPWAEAIDRADPGAVDGLREAAQDGCAFLFRCIALTAPMERVLVEARGATVALAAALERPGIRSLDGLREGACEAMDRLIAALREAKLSETAGAIDRIW